MVSSLPQCGQCITFWCCRRSKVTATTSTASRMGQSPLGWDTPCFLKVLHAFTHQPLSKKSFKIFCDHWPLTTHQVPRLNSHFSSLRILDLTCDTSWSWTNLMLLIKCKQKVPHWCPTFLKICFSFILGERYNKCWSSCLYLIYYFQSGTPELLTQGQIIVHQ